MAHGRSRTIWMGMAVMILMAGTMAQAADETSPAAGLVPGEIAVTPDSIQWIDAPPSLPPGVKIAVLEGDPAQPGPFVMRLKVPSTYRVPPHWHPAPERVTVLAGSLHLGVGDTFDETGGMTLPAGSYRVMPATTHHYGWTTEETILQLHGTGPWEIHYLNPADDHRTSTP